MRKERLPTKVQFLKKKEFLFSARVCFPCEAGIFLCFIVYGMLEVEPYKQPGKPGKYAKLQVLADCDGIRSATPCNMARYIRYAVRHRIPCSGLYQHLLQLLSGP